MRVDNYFEEQDDDPDIVVEPVEAFACVPCFFGDAARSLDPDFDYDNIIESPHVLPGRTHTRTQYVTSAPPPTQAALDRLVAFWFGTRNRTSWFSKQVSLTPRCRRK